MAGSNCEIGWKTRLCQVGDELGQFHIWEQWSNVVDASPLRGGHPGGQIGQVYGIVEFKDGVRRVAPTKIKFCDEENAILAEMDKRHQETKMMNRCEIDSALHDFETRLDEFLKRTGIELLPFQKEIIKKMADGNKIYICYPPHVGRINTILLMQALGAVFEKGEHHAEN